MAASSRAHSLADKRLSISRETELLQSFVRGNVSDQDDTDDERKYKKEKAQTQEQQLQQLIQIAPESDQRKNSQVPDPIHLELTKEVTKKYRKRRKRVKHEELYCDKDRAAAANMGSKDIRYQLKIKQKQDRSKALRIPEEADPSSLIALGNYEIIRGELEIGENFLNKALELNPSDKTALVSRSRCYILLGKPQKALEDAESALKLDKRYLKAIYQKAEALYYLGDFEHSLVFYHRGLHIRPDQEDFKLGVHKAQKAIENALATAFQHLQIHRKGKNSKKNSARSSTKTISSRPKSGKSSRVLRELAPDKDYLEELMKNPNLKCKSKEGDGEIVKCIQDTVEYLNARQEFWRQQLPPNST